MDKIETVFYEDYEGETMSASLLVFRDTLDIDEFAAVVRGALPLAVIPPWDISPAWTSRAAERAKQMSKSPVGVVIPPTEEMDFFLWATDANYSPLVFLPHRTPMMRRMMNLNAFGYLSKPLWIHLPGLAEPFIEESFPAIHFTTGVEF